jgi:hypothetical protein
MKRKLWFLAMGLLLAALAVPYISAGFVRQALQNSLELALSRKVRIGGETRFRILPTPAILASDVTISEDPKLSLEPFAYVTELEVHPSFLALLAGRLEATRLRLTEPSVNLMHTASGWNIQSLVSGNLRPPEVEVRNGRLNFKQGNSKNAFYLTNALVDISAPTAQGDLKLFFSAEPARTDRGAQGFGAFSMRGSIHAPSKGVPTLDFDVELQPSSLHAFNFFFGARGVDFAGKLSGRGRLKGEWDKAALEATIQFEGLEPQGFLPFTGNSNQVALSGVLDIPGQRLALDTVGGDSLRVRMRARDFFLAPKGAFLVELRQIELTKLLELGREANAKLPDGISAQGKFNGVIGYSWPSTHEVPAKGMIWFADATIDLPDQPDLKIPIASAVVEGSNWILSPAEIRVGESQTAVMRAEWNARNGALKLGVATQLLSVKGLKTGLGLLLQASSLPLLSRAQGGSWQGMLQYERSEDSDAGRWSGRLGVRNLSVELDGITGPLEVSTATIQFDPNRIAVRRMRAEWDAMDLEGEVSYTDKLDRPLEVNLTIAEASATHLTRLLQAAQRPPAGLLDKIRLRKATMPEWLRTRHASGQLRFKTLHFGSGSFEPLHLNFIWRAEKLEAKIEAAEFSVLNQVGSIHAKGKLSTELWQPAVQYRWEGTVEGWPLDAKTVSMEGAFKGASLESDWLDSLEGEAVLDSAEAPKLQVRQGKLTLEFAEGRRKTLTLTPPYWPLTIPPEP